MCAAAARVLPRAEVVVFDRSSHAQHVEEATRFLAVVAEFLDRSEA
jgi:pimeloyl-ACP methyl ester carboxylesterase